MDGLALVLIGGFVTMGFLMKLAFGAVLVLGLTVLTQLAAWHISRALPVWTREYDSWGANVRYWIGIPAVVSQPLAWLTWLVPYAIGLLFVLHHMGSPVPAWSWRIVAWNNGLWGAGPVGHWSVDSVGATLWAAALTTSGPVILGWLVAVGASIAYGKRKDRAAAAA